MFACYKVSVCPKSIVLFLIVVMWNWISTFLFWVIRLPCLVYGFIAMSTCPSDRVPFTPTSFKDQWSRLKKLDQVGFSTTISNKATVCGVWADCKRYMPVRLNLTLTSVSWIIGQFHLPVISRGQQSYTCYDWQVISFVQLANGCITVNVIFHLSSYL